MTTEVFMSMLSHSGDTGGVSGFQNRRLPPIKEKFTKISQLLTKNDSTPLVQRAHSLIGQIDANQFIADKAFGRQDSKLSGNPDFSIVSPNNIMSGPRKINPQLTRSLFNNSASAKSSFELQPGKKLGG